MLNAGETIDEYLVEDLISSPTAFSGITYLVSKVPSGEKGALKILKEFNNQNEKDRFYRENQITKSLNPHNHIINIFTDIIDKDVQRLYYVMELANGSLLSYATQLTQLTFTDKINIFKSICEGLNHAHKRNVVHRDLHWENVLYVLDSGVTNFKITDFGRSKSFDLPFLSPEGKPYWGGFVMPPEIKFGVYDRPNENASILGDIYALGVLLFFMFVRCQYNMFRLYKAKFRHLFFSIKQQAKQSLNVLMITAFGLIL